MALIYASAGSNNPINGTSGNDTIFGTSKADIIFGLGGNDTIYSGAGNDIIDGGSGNDTIYADGGNDTLIYRLSENIGSTDDFYDGQGGTDTLQLKLTDAQYATYVNELLNYQQLLTAGGSNDVFHFSFNLTVTEIENLQVTIVTDSGNAVSGRAAPVAANVSAKAAEDSAFIPITLKASDSDGTISSFKLMGLPSNGTLYTDSSLSTVVNTTNYYTATSNSLTLYFKPDLNFNGKVTFDYTAKDSTGLVDLTAATATITVTSVNDAPETNNVSATGVNSAQSIAIVLSGSDVDGFVKSFHINSLPGSGLLYTDSSLTTLVSTAGNIFYSATNNQLTLYFDPANTFSGVVTFSYSAKDDQNLIDPTPGTATIMVTGSTNVAPVNTVPGVQVVDEDSTLLFAGAISVNDVDGNLASTQLSVINGVLTVILSGGASISAGVNGTSSLTISGSQADINATLANLSYQGNLNYNGSDTLTVVSTDSASTPLSDTDTVAINITPVNDAPTTSEVTLTAIVEDSGPRVITQTELLENANDVDGPTLTASNLAIASDSGTLFDNGDGTWSYTPALNDDSAVSFNYTISDGSLSVAGSASMDITPVNDAPVITSNGGGDSAAISIPENSTAVTTVAALDPDVGTVLAYSIAGGADTAKFHIDSNTGALSFITAPNFEVPTDAGGNNVYNVTVQVSDGTLFDSQAIAVTVTNVIGNQPLFTTGNDTVNFNTDLIDPDVINPASYYDALAGNDTVTLPNLANAATIGYDFLLAFHAGDGNDLIFSGNGNDIVIGDAGTDTISYQSAGSTVIVNLSTLISQNTSGAGTDTLSGFENIIGSNFSDNLTGNAGNNVIDGGAGTDTVSYASAVTDVTVSLALQGASQDTVGAGLDILYNFENLTGSNFDDTLTGNASVNTIIGGTGDDTIDGGAGNDNLQGGIGIDTLSYASLTTGFLGQTVNLISGTSTGGAGTDTISGFENIIGSDFNDTLTGNANVNILNGGAGDDTIFSMGGDIMYGGMGRDDLIGGAGSDQFRYNSVNESSNFTGGPDVINNFNTNEDQVWLSVAGFVGGTPNTNLNISNFDTVINGNIASANINVNYIYDTTNNILYYDRNGGSHSLDPNDTQQLIDFNGTLSLKEDDIHFF